MSFMGVELLYRVSRAGVIPLVFRVHRHADERRGQEDEHERLQQADEDFQQAQGDEGQDAGERHGPEEAAVHEGLLDRHADHVDERQDDEERRVPGEHVGEQTNGQHDRRG